MPSHPAYFLPGLIAFVVEVVASIAWLPLYFRAGLPVLRLSFPLPSPVSELPAESSLEHDSRSEWTGKLVFRQLSGSEIAFQEAQFGFAFIRYLPAMHGLLRFLPDQQRGEIVGYANVSGLLLAGALVFETPPDWRLMAAPLFVLVFWGFGYLIQVYQYTKLRALLRDYVSACLMALRGR